ncbi:MAG: ABC transporter permease [Clostridiaceae bacterium]
MFFHNYIYRIKCILGNKQMMFWTFLFPIVLATLFNMAFANLYSSENFNEINIGIVKNEEYSENENFIKALDAVSTSKKDDDKDNLFAVKYTSKEDADTLLEDNKISGYIYFDNGLNLIVKESGIDQSILKGFLDDFQQTSSTIVTVISKEPTAIENGLIESISVREDYLEEVAPSTAEPDTTVNYFYSLIAMTCLYGGFLGLNEVVAIQANLSPQGARVNVAPTHKLKVFIVAILSATTVQLAEIFVLMAYLIFALKISFGSQIGYIALTCLVSTITGVTFGTCIASIIKAGEGIKTGIIIGTTMTMSFLSGMMYDKMKYIVNTKIPILRYLNPANLITDSFYSLYYYSNHHQYFINLLFLCGFIIVFSGITYMVLRRQKYASL